MNERPGRGTRRRVERRIFWRRQFGADPAIVGQSMTINGASWLILGVMPPGFAFPVDRPVDLWIPLVFQPADRIRPSGYHSSYNLTAVGRLKNGVTVEAARSQIELSPPGSRVSIRAGSRTARRACSRCARRLLVRRAVVDADAACGRWLRAVDRVRKRGQPDAGTRHQTGA